MAIPSIPTSLPAATAAKPAASPPQQARVAPKISPAEISTQDSASTVDSAAQALLDVAQNPAQPTRSQIDQAMEQMRDALPAVARNLQFSIDNDTGRTIVKVVDTTTNEVIRQMPSEELLAITKALDTFTGLLLKQKV